MKRHLTGMLSRQQFSTSLLPGALIVVLVLILVANTPISLQRCSSATAPSKTPTLESTSISETLTPTLTPTRISNSPTPTHEAVPTITPAVSLVNKTSATPQPAAVKRSPTATATPPTQTKVAQHTVAEGETLWGIAQQYGVSVRQIVVHNNVEDQDQILAGQRLIIPLQEPAASGVSAGATPTPRSAVSVAPAEPDSSSPANWSPSLIGGDTEINYPLTTVSGSGSLRIHYQPNTYPASNLDPLSKTADQVLADIEMRLGRDLNHPVDLYLAGTLFAVNPALQGYTQSGLYRTFVLVNGAFHPSETEYMLAHELTHIVSTHTFGYPSSVMLHEGLASYLPQKYLTEGAGYLPHEVICATTMQTPQFRSAVELAQLGYGATQFGGHIRTFVNYNLSGCFVGYLIETFGMEKLAQVYSSGNYRAVYDHSLSELDADWQDQLTTVESAIDATRFTQSIDEVARAYETYIAASSGGFHANWAAYLHLNQARLAANRGQLDQARRELDLFRSLMGF